MILFLLLLFNWCILFYVIHLGQMLFGSSDPLSQWWLGLMAFWILLGLLFIFDSPLGQWVLRLLSGARRLIASEAEKLNPAIEQVQESIQETHGFIPLRLHVMVIDDPIPNAFAIGKNTLVVSRALVETARPDELRGVIAHELGHLQAGDSRRLGMALGVSCVALTAAGLASLILIVTTVINQLMAKTEGGIVVVVGAIIITVVSIFFLLFVRLGNGVMRMAMLFAGRRQEYRADRFAVTAGFGNGLLSFLHQLKNFEWGKQKSFIGKLYETHPPIMLRIGEIEKMMRGEGV